MLTLTLRNYPESYQICRGDLAMSLDALGLLANPTPLSLYRFDICLQDQLISFIEQHRPTHLATATLFHEQSKLRLEDALNDWAIRVNRCYLGRRWYAPTLRGKAMKAFIYLVVGTRDHDYHAALLIKVPETADHLDFATRAPSFFAEDFRQSFPPEGDMATQYIPTNQNSTSNFVAAFLEKLDEF
jgi:hypothetical protein